MVGRKKSFKGRSNNAHERRVRANSNKFLSPSRSRMTIENTQISLIWEEYYYLRSTVTNGWIMLESCSSENQDDSCLMCQKVIV